MDNRKRTIGKSEKSRSRSVSGRVIRQTAIAPLIGFLFVSFITFSLLIVSFTARAERNDAALVPTDTREGRLAVFDDVWSTIHERYYDSHFHGLDWDVQRATFRSPAAEAGSSRELYLVLRRMIAALNDSHTRIYPPEERFDWWRPRFVSAGIVVREVEGLPVVIAVQRGSAPQRAGLRAGDIIESVNGTPALALVNSKLAESVVAASPPDAPSATSRFRAFATLLDGPPESSVEIRWQGKNGKERSAHFWRSWQQRELNLRLRREAGRYAIIEIDAFTKPIAAAFARVLKEKMAGVRGLILDLRNNGGGDTDAMIDIASAVVVDGSNLGQFTERSANSFTIFTRSKSLSTPERIAPTMLPLVVLASERTSSAAEIFVTALKASRRATIIGRETCGCVLAIRTRHLLPDGGLLDVSELDYRTATGVRLEGHGIKPDETVLVQRADLYSGRDRALDIAVRRLTRPLALHH